MTYSMTIENIKKFNNYKEFTMCKNLMKFMPDSNKITLYDNNPSFDSVSSIHSKYVREDFVQNLKKLILPEIETTENTNIFIKNNNQLMVTVNNLYEVASVSLLNNYTPLYVPDLLQDKSYILPENGNINQILKDLRIEFINETPVQDKIMYKSIGYGYDHLVYKMKEDASSFEVGQPNKRLFNTNKDGYAYADITDFPVDILCFCQKKENGNNKTLILVVAAGGIFYFYQILTFLQYRKLNNIYTNDGYYYTQLVSILNETSSILKSLFGENNISKTLVSEYKNLLNPEITSLFDVKVVSTIADIDLCDNDLKSFDIVVNNRTEEEVKNLRSFVQYYKIFSKNKCKMSTDKINRFFSIYNITNDITEDSESTDVKHFINMKYLESPENSDDNEFFKLLFNLNLKYSKLKIYIQKAANKKTSIQNDDDFKKFVVHVSEKINNDKKYAVKEDEKTLYTSVTGSSIDPTIVANLIIYKIDNEKETLVKEDILKFKNDNSYWTKIQKIWKDNGLYIGVGIASLAAIIGIVWWNRKTPSSESSSESSSKSSSKSEDEAVKQKKSKKSKSKDKKSKSRKLSKDRKSSKLKHLSTSKKNKKSSKR